jgi:hypothetical protein
MEERAKPSVRIDLAQFKLHVRFTSNTEVTLLFDSSSRRFYLSVVALVVHEMKRLGKITSIPLEVHADELMLLNETVGDSAGSSGNLIPRIYRKWKDALPDLENAPLFKVVGRKKGEGGSGKTYRFTEAEKDAWANLFDYKGSEEHVRLRFSIDKLGAGLDDVVIVYEDSRDGDAWERFIGSLNAKSDVSLLIWQTHSPRRAGKRASIERMAFPLPDKPSIAVLPFTNMSDDPKQEYLGDGLAEEIINALSRLSSVFVIARNSTFVGDGQSALISDDPHPLDYDDRTDLTLSRLSPQAQRDTFIRHASALIGLRTLAVFPVPIGSPFKGHKGAVHAEAVQYGRRGHRIEHLAPLGRDEIRGNDGRADLRSFGDDLEEVIGMLP